ncbi:GNAT family N-acetyltransferase [Vreelandella stevensii]|uniref:GNAT family N-acetyltransferase n=1 Tax=Vreelandella stevensii TaxID=502821 RepID=UPI000A031194|nr:GNAT family N-acetyltransferase [Halomonas stevensii]
MLHFDGGQRAVSPKLTINTVTDRIKSRKWSPTSLVPASLYRRELVHRLKVDQKELSGVRFRLASSLDEKEQAFRLVHTSYVERGIATPTRSGLTFSPFHILPGTTTFIAEKEGRIIGTISLVEDSPIGLPMEGVHPVEVAGLRYNGRRLAEVGTLAVASDVRGRGIPLILYNTLFRWARRYRMIEDLVIAVHPRVRTFYCNGLLFERLGPTRKYNALNGALSTPLHIDLTNGPARYRDVYDRGGMEITIAGRRTNLYRFFVEDFIEQVELPQNSYFPFTLSSPPIWSEDDVIAYFLSCRIEFGELPRQIKKAIENIYPGLVNKSLETKTASKLSLVALG